MPAPSSDREPGWAYPAVYASSNGSVIAGDVSIGGHPGYLVVQGSVRVAIKGVAASVGEGAHVARGDLLGTTVGGDLSIMVSDEPRPCSADRELHDPTCAEVVEPPECRERL